MKKISSEVQLYETDRTFPFRTFQSYYAATANHWHTEIEFIYLQDNSMQIYINNEMYRLQAGDIMIAAPGDIHGNVASDHHRIVVQFELDILETLYFTGDEIRTIRNKLETLERVSLFWPENVRQDMAAILGRLYNIRSDGRTGIGYKIQIQSLLFQLMEICWNHIPQSQVQTEKAKLLQNKKVLDNLEKVFNLVRDRYMDDLHPKDAAALLGVTPNHFIKYWRKYSNISFHAYLNEYRVSQAIALLYNSDDLISGIAFKVGFKSLKTFNRVFKSVTGVSPCSYRKQLRQ
ncbi:MAG: AraC family transcriptional regulator [Clostridiales bacterium]|nr:AraC family transcriptional regulator [Clostridiales bacterium]